jgi:hypothetical protein
VSEKEQMSKKLLTPECAEWQIFLVALWGAVSDHGCRHDHRHAEKIMADMGDVDIGGSVAFFEEHDGFCDCEVGLNVQDSWERVKKTVN